MKKERSLLTVAFVLFGTTVGVAQEAADAFAGAYVGSYFLGSMTMFGDPVARGGVEAGYRLALSESLLIGVAAELNLLSVGQSPGRTTIVTTIAGGGTTIIYEPGRTVVSLQPSTPGLSAIAGFALTDSMLVYARAGFRLLPPPFSSITWLHGGVGIEVVLSEQWSMSLETTSDRYSNGGEADGLRFAALYRF